MDEPSTDTPPPGVAATFRSYEHFTDPMLRAVAASPIRDADVLRWLGYADQELTRLRQLLDLPTRPGYALGRPQYAEGADRIEEEDAPPMRHSYFAGDELRHHAGDVWRVVEADLPGDGGFHGGMIELAGDYRIECVRGREAGSTRRVHADYLHGNGWTRVPSGVLR